MKITINTSVKGFENANYLLAEAIESVANSANMRYMFDLTEKDVELANRFRKAMVRGFLKEAGKSQLQTKTRKEVTQRRG